MTVAVALLLGSLIVATWGHRPLLFLLRSNRDPRMSIVLWLVVLVSVFTTSITGVVLLGLPGHGGVAAALEHLHDCWATLHHGASPELEVAAAFLGAMSLFAVAGRLAWVGVRQTRIRQARRERHRFLVTVAAADHADGTNVVWLDHPNSMAFSVAGRPGFVAVSQGTRDLLRPSSLAATLAHEQAHLRGRHHLLLDIVDAAAAAVPVAPLFRAAPGAMRELVELAADVAAVRRCGATAVADALRLLSAAPRTGGLGMGTTAAGRRLTYLQRRPIHSGSAGRSVRCTVAGLIAATVPAVLGLLLFTGVACSLG